MRRKETKVYTHYTKLQTRPLMQVERSLLSYHTPPSNLPSDLSHPLSLKRVLRRPPLDEPRPRFLWR